MTAHDHRSFVDGCYRCDLNRDELEAAGNECEDELDRLRAQRDAVLAMHKPEIRYWGASMLQTWGGETKVGLHGEHEVCGQCTAMSPAEVVWPCPTARVLGVDA